MTPEQEAADKTVREAVGVLAKSFNVTLSTQQLELIGAGVFGAIALISDAAVKKAIAAGVDAASKVTTVEQANAVMEAAAASQEKP